MKVALLQGFHMHRHVSLSLCVAIGSTLVRLRRALEYMAQRAWKK